MDGEVAQVAQRRIPGADVVECSRAATARGSSSRVLAKCARVDLNGIPRTQCCDG
jgi:hypothetical protein